MGDVQYRVVDTIPDELGGQHLFELETWEQALVRYVDGKPDKIVYEDGGEREDMLLRRDLGVFVDELNLLAGGL